MEKRNFYNQEVETVIAELATNKKDGLDSSIVEKKLKENGFNELSKKNKKTVFKIIISNFLEPFILVLLALLIIVGSLKQWSELGVILLIIVAELVLTIFQEVKSQKALESLKKIVKQKAVVIRNNKKIEIDARDLVVGDLVYLEAGMFVPADVRIIESFNLQVNESLLTGESKSVIKNSVCLKKDNLGVHEQTNIAFMSTSVVFGSALAVVIKTGENTEIGKINSLLKNQQEPLSPLNKQIMVLIRSVSILAIILSTILFLIQKFVFNYSIADGILYAIALAIAVIPEGLFIVVSASLSLASKRMALNHAIVKKLSSVETLGQVNVICTDKTGTLTENKMSVVRYFLNDDVQTEKEKMNSSLQVKLFMNALVLANNGALDNGKLVGDPTETALLKWSLQLGIDYTKVQLKYERIKEIPFDSQRKMMSSVNINNHDNYLFTKGSFDNLMPRCTHFLINDKRIKATKEMKEEVFNKTKNMAKDALRVLAIAYKPLTETELEKEDLENDLVFLGLVALVDLPRKEVKDSLLQVQQANIIVKMITGDSQDTALAIAQQLNIAQFQNQVISGAEIENLTDKQLQEVVTKKHVYARVDPTHKVRIVKALQDNNNIVAMIGDGVNDAASLKKSDIGVAMGHTGSDVAKEAAQLVLTNDNFSTILSAIKEGRNIYNKLKISIGLILIVNLAQVLAIILSTIFGFGQILGALQILWVNLIVESVLAINITMAKNDDEVMFLKPVKKGTNILKNIWIYIVISAFSFAIVLLLSFKYLPLIFNQNNNAFVFIVLINSCLLIALSLSCQKKFIFNKIIFNNMPLLISIFICFILNAMVIFIPGLNNTFNVSTAVSFVNWIYCLLISFIPMLFLEGIKLIIKKLKLNNL